MPSKQSDRIEAGQTIEQLQQRYDKLNTKKITAAADLKNAETQLQTLRREAKEKYGTEDLAELREKLAAMKADNEAQRRDYEAKLNTIEADLKAVEEKFSAAETVQGTAR